MSNHLLAATALLGVFAAAALAQSDDNPAHSPDVFLDNHRPLIQKREKPATSRTVRGKVVDGSGKPLEGALVTLTDLKTNDKTTVITKKDGRYNFEDISFTVDYQVQARYKDLLSDTRKLSQYDRSPNIVRILQVGPSAPASGNAAEAKKETASTPKSQ